MNIENRIPDIGSKCWNTAKVNFLGEKVLTVISRNRLFENCHDATVMGNMGAIYVGLYIKSEDKLYIDPEALPEGVQEKFIEFAKTMFVYEYTTMYLSDQWIG